MLRIAENINAELFTPYEFNGEPQYMLNCYIYEDQTVYNNNFFMVFQDLSKCDSTELISTPFSIGMSYNNDKKFISVEL